MATGGLREGGPGTALEPLDCLERDRRALPSTFCDLLSFVSEEDSQRLLAMASQPVGLRQA